MIERTRAAVVVVDMQNDFCDERGYYGQKGLPIPPVRTAIPALARLLSHAREREVRILFTRLIHDPAVADVAQRHSVLPSKWIAQEPRLVPGSWGAEIIEELRPRSDEAVFDKSDYSAFHGTGLEGYLRRAGIRTLVLTGTTDYACVLHTAFDAFCRDFDVVIPRECVSGWYPDLGEAALRMVELLLGSVLPAEQVLAEL